MSGGLIKERRNNIIFCIIRFGALLVGYGVTLLTQSNFQGFCMGLIVITLTISSDYLILLLTQDKENYQFIISVLFFLFSLFLEIILGAGCLGFIKYDGILHLVNTSLEKNVYNFKFLSINSIAILCFILMCAYIFEYTGVLKRSKAAPSIKAA